MPAILLFLKAPREGYVKTRLANAVGPKQALVVYQTLVECQLTQLDTKACVEIHFAPSNAGPEMKQWLGVGYNYYPQVDGELGARLSHAVEAAFERGAQHVICIGGDCPKLDKKYLKQASTLLDEDCDVVFGPSKDGGYYLIGLKAPQPSLFQDIPWSTNNTLKVSLEKAVSLGLRIQQLETLYDIDEVEDLNRAVKDGLLPADLRS